MLIRSLTAVLLAALLAGCTFGAPSVLAPVRDGVTGPDPADRTGPESVPHPPSPPAAEPGPNATAPAPARSTENGARAATTRGDGERDPPADWPGTPAPAPVLDVGPAHGSRNSAVVALLESAREAADARQYGRAAATLERALKVEPRNPRLWHRLAVVRFRQGRDAEADALALRSRSLTVGDPDLDARNWRLTAAVRQRTGDGEGALDALRRARGG